MARYIRGSFILVCFTAFCQPCFCAPDCESCTLLVSTNPASTAASGLELTRETYFVAHRLEYVAVDVLLWRMWWCVLRAARFCLCFCFYPCERTGPTACITSCETIKARGNVGLLMFLFLSLRTHRAYSMHHFLRNNQGMRKRWLVECAKQEIHDQHRILNVAENVAYKS